LAKILDLCGQDVPVIGVWSDAIEIRANPPRAGGPVRGMGGGDMKGGKKGKDMLDPRLKGKGKEVEEAPKQGRICREWSLPKDGELKILEQTSFDLDKVGVPPRSREEHH